MALPPAELQPAAQVDAPPGLDNLRSRRHLFVGRASELDLLDAALDDQAGAVVQAVHGLGGIGKSTLAAHWAATRAHGCAPVRWIEADSRAGVQQGLADLATALQPALASALPVEKLAERALQWLATHTGWLLILDNVNDPADIATLTDGLTTGRLLITSRLATTWHHATNLVRLDVLGPDESLDLLTRIATSAGPRDLDGTADLCAELGHLPLAIEQAAAYLVENQLTTPTPRAYLDLIAQHPADMYRDAVVGTAPERTIARIWHLTLDRITALHRPAADLLRTLAWYAPDHIPTTLLNDLADPPARNKAIGLLTAYSMISPDPGTGTVAIHRLVQALARTADPQDPHRQPHDIARARDHATQQLVRALPDDETPKSWPAWRALVPHVDALIDHALPETDTDTTADLVHRVGGFLRNQGAGSRVITYAQRALSAYQRVLGTNHLVTLNARIRLAYAYQAAGDLDKAIALFEQTLVDRLAAKDTPSPDAPGDRTNLAASYEWAGDHLRRAMALHAYANGGAGHLEQAVRLHERILATRQQELGDSHPATLASRSNLADAYRASGDSQRAASLDQQTLAHCLREVGEDHPLTTLIRHKLAGIHTPWP
ncbi:tetratricopeptide repeat protein [Streptomyces sp. NPDC006692]|uniref:tetratricopeptide repeat protein n=1 Tax=Streptomyces sp. NPDC006692 TaxID=3364758 RepID=UPI0036A654A1